MLTKDQILSARDGAVSSIDVPEWGGKIWVKALSGAEREDYQASMVIRKGDRYEADLKYQKLKLLIRCISDESGKRLFSDQDMSALGAKSGLVLNRIYNEAARINGLGDDAVEEEAKN